MRIRVLARAAACALAFATAPVRADDPAPPTEINVKQLFATSCGWCHQNGGRTQGRGPKLMGTEKTDEEIITQIRKGNPRGMPAFGQSFNDAQIHAIVAYIRGLKDGS